MDGMWMPGASTMAMTWMPMPGQTWATAAFSFLGTWTVMMAAMMLPSLVPMLSRYRKAMGRLAESRAGVLTTLAGTGYLATWTLLGIVVFAVGALLAAAEMELASLARVVPLALGALVMAAGALQFTRWKAHHLACWREAPRAGRMLRPDVLAAWRDGMRLGLHCICCSAGPMAILFVAGLMNVGAMAAVTAAITAERLAPDAVRVARVIGVVAIAAGVLLVAHAAALH